MRLFVFGEEIENLHVRLRTQLIESRGHSLLENLFRETANVLRHEIASLSAVERHDLPIFSTLNELNDRSERGVSHAGIENALLFISSIASYVRYCTHFHPDSGQDVAVGISTGSLAAATIALSPYVATLIPLAAEICLIAFRLGLCVQKTAQQLGSIQNDQENTSWSSMVVRMNESEMQAILGSFQREVPMPTIKVPYVSESSSHSVVIAGPRPTIDLLNKFHAISPIKRSEPRPYEPYHASHLHREEQVRDILFSMRGDFLEMLNKESPRTPLVTSTIKASPQNPRSMLAILEEVIREILRFQWTTLGTIEGIAYLIEEQYPGTREYMECAPTKWQDDLLANLRKAKFEFTWIDPPRDILKNQMHDHQRTTKRPLLAIVGMAGRFPDAADIAKFWSLLEAGLDVHREVPSDRFDIKKYYDPASKIRNTSHTPFGCWIEEPGLFDPRFFNMSPREATQTDPMHRLGLVTAYEALEMAGYVPNRTPSTQLDRIGTFYGQTSDDWREINAAQNVDTYFITGGVRAFAPGRINYHFKFTGPSFNIDTACSSSAAAIQLACTSLWAEDCDTAVAGGLNVMTNSDIFAGLSRGQFLSKTGNCQTYDNDADGYCRGDGIGSIIIKRLEDAEADNDRILGVISGIATNHSSNAISITHPHAPTQEKLFSKVMDDAGLDPHEVDYVEMHGTGTQAGDSTEMESVTNVFAPSDRAGTRTKPLHIGSVKANVGHGEAVSGVTAIIKATQMLQKNMIPPHCGIKKAKNKGFPQDLDMRNVHIALKPTPFPSNNAFPRRIFVNNFSAAGGNTAIMLEDAPYREAAKEDPRGKWIVAVSAKSKAALSRNIANLIQYLKQTVNIRLSDLSYTSTARRIQHNFRIAFPCDTLVNAVEGLTARLDLSVEPVSPVKPGIAFAYTGQGSHYSALGNQLFNLSSVFRSDLTNFNAIAASLGYPSFLPLVDGSVDAKDLSPLIIQLGLTCIQMALTRWWASIGIKPSVVTGHSLGEYAALNAAKVLSVSDTIYLVGERAKLLHEKCRVGSHAMLAVKASVSLLEDALLDVPEAEYACVNGPEETIMAGPLQDIDALAEKLGRKGTKCTKLNTPYAFHSSQISPILDEFEDVAQHVQFNRPQIPLISPLLAEVVDKEGIIDGSYLGRHARDPVNFNGGLKAARQVCLVNQETVWVELGPHPVCSGFIRAEFGMNVTIASTFRKAVLPYETISESISSLYLAGLDIDWNEYHKDFIACVRMLDLPAYAWDNKNYWIQYSGDWNLRKGELAAGDPMPEPDAPKRLTTSVQRVTDQVVDYNKASLKVESDLSDSALLTAVSGHMVNGTALCPSSLYADMALTIGEYLHSLLQLNQSASQVNVGMMEVFKPFIANEDGGKGQTLRLTASVDRDDNRGTLFFSSGSGKAEIQHAKCHISYGSGGDWLSKWQRQGYLIKERINYLENSASSGQSHRMLRGMAYKLFGAFVEYDQRYRGMGEVILDSPQLEATAQINFQTSEADGTFLYSPYWIDSVCHLAGFIVNANDTIDSSKHVYVSHGWESMRFAEPLKREKTYQSYVKMQPMPDNIMAGDVYVLDGDRIIGLCETLKFQCIPRSLLNTFLPPKKANAATPAAAKSSSTIIKTGPKKPTKLVVPKPKKTSLSSPTVIDRALHIIAAEVGVPLVELADSVEISNLGIDSLMSLSISSRIREDLSLEIQATAFSDYRTIGAVKEFLKSLTGEDSTQIGSSDSDTMSDFSLDVDDTSSHADSISTQLTPPDSPPAPGNSQSLSRILRQIISEGMEVDVVELMSISDLSTAGMDSLMALSLLSTLREKTDLELPADFFTENRNIKAMEAALEISDPEQIPEHRAAAKPQAKPALESALAPPVSVEPQQKITSIAKQKAQSNYKATSILLQGNPKTSTKQAWLIPDGGGAPTSYNFPSTISPSLTLWGLMSPFLKAPETFIVGVKGIASMYIEEMKRRQPSGPYHLGGWSAGGVIAYEISQQLLAAGDAVETLILIDTPCPLIIEPLPSSLHRFFGSIGLLGDGDGALEKLPWWLLPHFAASVHALSTYDAAPLPTLTKQNRGPVVWLMWCEDGVCKTPDDPRPDPYLYGHAQWLLENRTDLGPNEWVELLDERDIKIEHMEGNHFSMMREPRVGRLVEFLRRALAG